MFTDLHDAANLLSRGVSNLAFLPQTHISAFEAYVHTLLLPQSNPSYLFHNAFLALQSTIQAMLSSLSRPPQLVAQIVSSRKAIERNYNSVSRSTRWPLGLLDETRQRLNEEREEKARRAQMEVDTLSKELRYTQQTVASELAGWEDMHERMGRRAIKEFARGMLILERERLQGLRRAQRKLQDLDLSFSIGPQETNDGVGEAAVMENGLGKDPVSGESSTTSEAFVDRID